jgi:hypothetical protein
MLIGGIVAAVAVVVLLGTVLTRRVSHDDVHSVEGYHRSLHTLETINAHPAETVRSATGSENDQAKAAYPESAVRLAGSAYVRVTDNRPGAVPPVPPPPVADADEPVKFDDDEKPPVHPPTPVAAHRDKAMVSINHRPRRLAAPATALAVVAVLIIVLLLTGSHTTAPPRHTGATKAGVTAPTSKPHVTAPTTSSTVPAVQPPAVSLPQGATSTSATYDVASTDFTLAFSATTGVCWVDATNSTTGSTYFEGTLEAGEQRSFDVTGPVSIEIGAPSVFAATVDGDAVGLPSGYQTPFTMSFVRMTASSA